MGTTGLKTSLAWLTSFLLIFAAWTAQYQMKPVARSLMIGIAGTLMIFCAEFIYSYRKRGRIKYGSVRAWLRLHIAIGIIGPSVILWHTGLNFHGFAGWLTLLTMVVLASGFIGRYIYRQIPRTIKGRELSLRDLNVRRQEIERNLRREITKNPRAGRLIEALRANFPLLNQSIPGTAGDRAKHGWFFMLGLSVEGFQGRMRSRRLPAEAGLAYDLAEQLKAMELERLGLVRSINVLSTSKRLLSRWKLLHIPLTLSLFVGIIIHMTGIFYYGQVLP